MVYKCFNCKKEIETKLVERRLICPYCGYRVIIKTRKPALKKVKAR